MIERYVPPSKWWRRDHQIQLTWWPLWLAQLLCPHHDLYPSAWNLDGSVYWNQCGDCGKILLVSPTRADGV